MRGKTGKQSEILQELESDDELPDVYNDATILPAYLLDNRFDDINFAWINLSEEQIKSKANYDNNQYLKRSEKEYIKGILKRQDLYCLKSVETLTCSATLVWFAKFLLLKDLQSRYKYLRSCLVNDFLSIPLASISNKNDEIKNSNNKLEVVIKL